MKKCIVTFLLLTVHLYGLPENLRRIGNEKSILHVPSSLTIKCKEKEVIYCDDFSIQPTESIRFILPHEEDAVMIRVVGKKKSQIGGTIVSNGSVFIMNPNGIVLREGADIFSFGFLAVTGILSELDFLNQNDLHFRSFSGGSIEISGQICCSRRDVTFICDSFQNRGNIVSEFGNVSIIDNIKTGDNVIIRKDGNFEVIQVH